MIDVQIQVSNAWDAAQAVERVRRTAEDSAVLHADIAGHAENMTRDYIRANPDHKTAEKLGAAPFHFAWIASRIESAADATAAIIRGPRASRLRAYLGAYVVAPKDGKKFLAIPADRRTYGRRAAEMQDQLEFGVDEKLGRVLFFKGTREPAFTLRRRAKIPGDPTVLPSDESYLELATRVIMARLGAAAAATEGGAA